MTARGHRGYKIISASELDRSCDVRSAGASGNQRWQFVEAS